MLKQLLAVGVFFSMLPTTRAEQVRPSLPGTAPVVAIRGRKIHRRSGRADLEQRRHPGARSNDRCRRPKRERTDGAR